MPHFVFLTGKACLPYIIHDNFLHFSIPKDCLRCIGCAYKLRNSFGCTPLSVFLFCKCCPCDKRQKYNERNSIAMVSTLKRLLFLMGSIGLMAWSLPLLANCSGCLCPGDPCNLCPLPAMVNDSPKENEHALCAKIREKVPPTDALPGSNDYFPSLDKSVAVCVGEGGDIIRNRQKLAEYPSRFYCKPPGRSKQPD